MKAMQKAKMSKKRCLRSCLKRNWLITTLFCFFSVWAIITLVRQEMKLAELHREEISHKAQLETLKKEITSLEQEIMKSQSSEFIEQMAKEKLKMVKNDEIIYYIKGSKQSK